MSYESDVATLAVDVTKLHSIIHGGAFDTVATEGGTVLTAANAIRQLVGMVLRGDWVSSTQYAFKDLVAYNGALYICTTTHTAGTFSTDLAAGRWIVYQSSTFWRYSSLNEAVAAQNPATLVIDLPTSLTANLTVPQGVALDVQRSGSIALNGFTLRINGAFEAPVDQIFTGTGTVYFDTRVNEVYPEWFGVTGTNDEVAINKAITALDTSGGTVWLSKDYQIDTNPVLAASGVIIDSKAKATYGIAAAHIHGGMLHNRRASGGAILVGNGLRDVVIRNIGIHGDDAGGGYPTANRHGIELVGTTSTRNVTIEHCEFFLLDKAIYEHGNGTWDLSLVSINNNSSNQNNMFIYSSSYNFNFRADHNDINFLDTGIFLYKSNVVNITDNISAAVGGIAESTFIKLQQSTQTNIVGNQNEQTKYSIRNVADAGSIYATNIVNNVFSGLVQFDAIGAYNIFSQGNYYYDNFNILASQINLTASLGDVFASGKKFVMTPSTNSRIALLSAYDGKLKFNVTGDDYQTTAAGKEIKLTTTNDTVIAGLIPWSNAGANTFMYRIHYYFFVLNGATNVRIHLVWGDPTGNHDIDLVANASKAPGSYYGTDISITAINGGAAIPIEVRATAGTADNVYVTAIIEPIPY